MVVANENARARYSPRFAVFHWCSLVIISAMAIISYQIIWNHYCATDILDSDLAQIPRIGASELKTEMDAGVNLLIIDVRPKEEYIQGHLFGAISLPLEDTDYRDVKFKGYKQIVTYCT